MLAMVQSREVQAVIVAKLDRLTRSVRDLCELLELFERRGVALISVAESLDTSSAAGRLVINIMAPVIRRHWAAHQACVRRNKKRPGRTGPKLRSQFGGSISP